MLAVALDLLQFCRAGSVALARVMDHPFANVVACTNTRPVLPFNRSQAPAPAARGYLERL